MEIFIPVLFITLAAGAGIIFVWFNRTVGMSDMDIGQAMLTCTVKDKWKKRPADRNGPPIKEGNNV